MRRIALTFEHGRHPVGRWLRGHPAQASGMFGIGAALCALAAVGYLGWQGWNTELQTLQARAELQNATAAHVRAANVAGAKPATPGPSPQQVASWNPIIRALNLPWPQLLDALEGTTPANVALVSIEPDARQSRIRLQAEAQTLDALLAYAGTLRTQGAFTEVLLVKHELNDQDPNRPTRLTVDLLLAPALGARADGAR